MIYGYWLFLPILLTHFQGSTRQEIIQTKIILMSHNNNWVAPCKPALCDYFIAIFQVAQNWLKFGMSTLFVLKNVPVFFKNAEKYGQNCVKLNPLPSLCPSPNNVGFWYLRAKTQSMCLLRFWWGRGEGGNEKGRGEGVDFQERVWRLVSLLVEKNCRDIFSPKKGRHAKFQRILSYLENR